MALLLRRRPLDTAEAVSSAAVPSPAASPSSRRGISLRATLLGLALVVVNVWWLTLTEVRYDILDGSSLPLFITPVFLLLLLVAGNAALRRALPRLALQQEELLTAYLMAVLSTAFAGQDVLQNLIVSLAYPYYFATPENSWQDLFLRKLPQGLFVTDPEALAAWYQGNADAAQRRGYLVHWIVPLTLWGGFLLLIVFVFGCIALLFRRRWTEDERLAFPIIQLPLALTEPGGAFFRNSRMWVGFALAFGIGLVNGIHELYPSVPNAPWIKRFDVGQFFTVQPWEAIRTYGMQTSLYPFAIGLAYFIPLDLAFSCWFSYLLIRGQYVFGRATGWDGPSVAQGWPFTSDISLGCWIGLAGAILWSSRRYLAQTFQAAFPRTASDQALRAADPAEARRYRAAYIGLFAGSLGLMGWGGLLGLAPLVTFAFFALLLAFSLAVTRIRAEFGVPHAIAYARPVDVLINLFGTKALGEANLIGMQAMYWFTRGYRCHPMPNLLEGFKIAEGKNMPVARLVGIFVLASVVSLLVGYAVNYQITYAAGAASKAAGYETTIGRQAFVALDKYLRAGQTVGAMPLWYFVGGLTFVGALAYLRATFLWWPLHPAGLALATATAMNYFWLPVFIAWLAKLLIIRYGGMNAHKRAVPFFLGLVLGDYTIGALWSLLGLLLGQPTYRIYI